MSFREQGVSGADFDYAYGDSIAVGLNSVIDASVNVDPQTSAVDGETIAKQGIDPTTVLSNIRNITAKFELKGLTIALSSGTSNGPSKTSLISAQIEALKQAGAIVALVGVSTTYNDAGFDGAGLNRTLQAIATQAGIKFIGGFEAGRDNVHPKSYPALYKQAVTALA